VFARETDVNVSRALCTVVCAAVAYRSKLNPIYLVAASALLGLAGVFG
jgi:chromate transporter